MIKEHHHLETAFPQRDIDDTSKIEEIKNLLDGYITFLNLQVASPFFIPYPKPDDGRIFPLSEVVFERVIIELRSRGYRNVDLLEILENVERIEGKSGRELKEELVEYLLANLWDDDNPNIQRGFGLALAPFISQDQKYLVINLFFQLQLDENKKKLYVKEPVWNEDIYEIIQEKIKSSGNSLPKSLTDPENLIKALEITWTVFSGLGTISLEPYLNIGISLLFHLPFQKLIKRLSPDKSLISIPERPFPDIPYSVFVFWYTDELFTKRVQDDLKKVKSRLDRKIVNKLMNLYRRQEPSIVNEIIFKQHQLSFFEYELTESQKKAYKRILGQEITSIEGPPGTGKTHLISIYCLDMLIHNKKVLVISTNNKAVDNVLDKLKQFDNSIKDMILTGRYLPGYIRISSGNVPSRDELPQAIENFLLETYPDKEIKDNIQLLEKEVYTLKKFLDKLNRLEYSNEELNKINEDISKIKEEITSLSGELFISQDKANFFNKDNLLTFSELLERLNKFYAFFLDFLFNFKGSFMSYAFEKGIKILGQKDNKYISCKSLYKRNLKTHEKLKNFIELKESLEEREKQKNLISFDLDKLEEELNRLCLELKLPNNRDINEVKRRLVIRIKELNYWRLQGDKEFKKTLENGIKEIKEGKLWNYTKEILEFSPIILVTALSSPKVAPPKVGIFDTAIVDEGSQTLFVYTLPAFIRSKKFVVIGDKHQLGPVIPKNVFSQDSLKEYFSRFPSHLHYLKSATEVVDYIDSISDAERRLKEHFRCHTDIISFCDKLCNYALEIKTPNRSYNFKDEPPDWVKELFECPLVFINIDGKEQKCGYATKKNEKEAEFIVNLLKNLSSFVKMSDVGIITPYKGQSNYIKEKIRNILFDPNKPVIGTVHILQGDEREIIIMSLVCTNPNSLRQSKLLNDKNLINVAVSRAKKHLILVGNEKVFEETDLDNSPIVKLYRHIKDKGKVFEKWEWYLGNW